jgi:hypothetical protein
MRKFTIARVGGTDGFAVFDVRGNRVGRMEFAAEWEAHLAAVHWACSGSLAKRLRLKKVNGVLAGRPFGGVRVVGVYKQPSGEWRGVVEVDGEIINLVYNTMTGVLNHINRFGDDLKKTRNMLNPASKEFDIARRDWGGCTDPGSETYHCM